MLEALEAAVEGLELRLDGDELVAAQRCVDRLVAKLALAYGDFDAHQLWDLDGATSMTAWLGDRSAMAAGDAARTVATGSRLRRLPVTATAAVDATLSGGQLKAVLPNVSERTEERFAGHEAELVASLAALSVRQCAQAMRWWAMRAEADADEAEPRPEPASKLSLSRTLGGRWRLDAELGPLDGEVLDTTLRLAQGFDADGRHCPQPSTAPGRGPGGDLSGLPAAPGPAGREPASPPRQRDRAPGSPAGPPRRGVPRRHRDRRASLGALSCDSVLHRVLVAVRSTVLDYGTSTRTISANLFAALVVRDRHCRFPGCDRPASWCEAHHVVHVADGGPACPSNLVLVCSRHHHRLHQPGWSATLGDDAELVVSDPEGRHRTSHPQGHSPRPATGGVGGVRPCASHPAEAALHRAHRVRRHRPLRDRPRGGRVEAAV